MQISANNLLQAAQQALSARPAAKQPAAQPFEPANFAPDTETPSAQPAQNTAPGAIRPPGSQVDIRI
jgi:hypothetical protein